MTYHSCLHECNFYLTRDYQLLTLPVCIFLERASQSLGPVRYALHSPIKSPGSKSTFLRGDNYSSAGTTGKLFQSLKCT